MRTLGFPACLLLLAGCAALEPHADPLTADDVIARTGSGASSREIVDEFFRTGLVRLRFQPRIRALSVSGPAPLPRRTLGLL